MRRTAPRLEPLEDRTTPAGQLDPTFGTSGLLFPDFGGVGEVNAVVVQPDGKVVMAGSVISDVDGYDFVIARLTSAGQPDPTFGTGGYATIDCGGDEIAAAVAVQQDGKIVVVGNTRDTGGNRDYAIARLTPDGQPDASFGSGGRVTYDFGFDDTVGVAVQPDGKIIVGGENLFTAAALRLTATGQLDPTFGSGGQAADFGGPIFDSRDCILQPDGKVVLVGFTGGLTPSVAVVRMTADGQLDTDFGTDGRAILDFGVVVHTTTAVLQPDGKLVLGGSTADPDNYRDFAAIRLTADGQPDPGFGTAGLTAVDFGMYDTAYDVALQPDGSIVLAGNVYTSFGYGLAALRLTADGQPDPTYGTGGWAVYSTSVSDVGYALAVQSDGKAIVAGYTYAVGVGSFPVAIRLTSAPPPNAAPQLSAVAGRAVPEGGDTGAVPFTVSDAETPAADLTVTADSSNPTLVPPSGITLSGSGGNRTVTVAPLPGQYGTAMITLTVTDAGGQTATSVFTVSVSRPAPPPPLSLTGPWYATPSNAMSVAAGDFNNDGTVDAVVSSSGGVTVFLNDGAAVMTVASEYDTQSVFPRFVRAADLTGDGDLDVITANDLDHNLSIFVGNGDGTFQAPVLVPVSGTSLTSFAVNDFDGDAKPDLVTVTDFGLAFLRNVGGAGILAAAVGFATGTAGFAIDTADFNHDAAADLVVADLTSHRLVVLLGVGDGTFDAPVSIATGAGSGPAAVIARTAGGGLLDFDGDGNVDLAAGFSENGTVGVLLGDGVGGFSTPTAYATNYPRAGRLTAADFDADGLLDLAVLGSGLGTVTTLPVFIGDGDGGFSSAFQLDNNWITTDVTAADLDADGRMDLLGTIDFSPGFLAVSLNTTALVASFEVSAPAVVTAGVPFTVTVTARDAGGATFAGYRGAVRFTSADGAAFFPADLRFTAADNGVKTFTVTLNTSGTPSFTVGDGVLTGVSTTTPVTVFRANHAPTVGADTLTIAEDSADTVVEVLANDSAAPDPGETLTVTSVTPPAHGTVTFLGGVIRYTPAANYTGTDSFTYTITDDYSGPTGPRTAVGTVTVTVTPVNDPPTAEADTLTVAEDAAATVVPVLANDSSAPDAGETLTVTAVTQPAHGTVTLVGGVVSYTPAADFNGTDAFTYTVSDGNGGTTTATVAVTVTPVNDPPTATGDDLTVAEDAPATVVPVLANDSAAPDTGETLTVTAVTQPAHGTVTLVGGVVQYTPAPNYHGADSFTYTVSDGNGGTATATVTVTVTPVNDPPTPAPDTLTVAEDAPATAVPVLANDSAAPDTGETLGVVSVTQPANGVVTLAGGVVTYTPAADYSGPDFFTYAVSDGASVTVVSVAVTVTPVNDPPAARGDAFSVAFNAPATTLAVLANDATGPDAGETLIVTAVTQPAAGGTVAVAPGGTGVTFTPAAGFSGTATFTYTAGDGTPGSTATATVTVTVGGLPSFGPVRPVAVGGSADGTVRLTAADGTTTTVAPFGNTGTPTRTASADVDGDGVADVVAVTGPGTALQLAVLSGKDGSVLVPAFDPFGGGFPGGGYVAAADLDRDGRAEFVVTPDQGGGPRVTIFGLTPGGAPTTLANFFGIDDPNFRGGARGAVGDVDGDGTPDLIVAAGFGGGPRVAIFSGPSVAAGAPARLVNDFFAFPGGDATSLRNGAFVAAGDVTGDGFADLVFGGGPGGAPRVFILSGALVSAGDVAGAQASPVANFFVGGNLSDRGGARVGVTNSDGDDKADLVVGSGAGQPARVRLYLGKTITGGGEPAGAIDLDPPGGGALTDGVYVG